MKKVWQQIYDSLRKIMIPLLILGGATVCIQLIQYNSGLNQNGTVTSGYSTGIPVAYKFGVEHSHMEYVLYISVLVGIAMIIFLTDSTKDYIRKSKISSGIYMLARSAQIFICGLFVYLVNYLAYALTYAYYFITVPGEYRQPVQFMELGIEWDMNRWYSNTTYGVIKCCAVILILSVIYAGICTFAKWNTVRKSQEQAEFICIYTKGNIAAIIAGIVCIIAGMISTLAVKNIMNKSNLDIGIRTALGDDKLIDGMTFDYYGKWKNELNVEFNADGEKSSSLNKYRWYDNQVADARYHLTDDAVVYAEEKDGEIRILIYSLGKNAIIHGYKCNTTDLKKKDINITTTEAYKPFATVGDSLYYFYSEGGAMYSIPLKDIDLSSGYNRDVAENGKTENTYEPVYMVEDGYSGLLMLEENNENIQLVYGNYDKGKYSIVSRICRPGEYDGADTITIKGSMELAKDLTPSFACGSGNGFTAYAELNGKGQQNIYIVEYKDGRQQLRTTYINDDKPVLDIFDIAEKDGKIVFTGAEGTPWSYVEENNECEYDSAFDEDYLISQFVYDKCTGKYQFPTKFTVKGFDGDELVYSGYVRSNLCQTTLYIIQQRIMNHSDEFSNDDGNALTFIFGESVTIK